MQDHLNYWQYGKFCFGQSDLKGLFLKKALCTLGLFILTSQTFISSQTTMTFNPVKDATIFSDQEGSNGAGNIFTGRNNEGDLRRGLIMFDLGDIPGDAIVTNVDLVLRGNKANATGFKVHRLTADWGESASAGSGNGGGQPGNASNGDATWNANFLGTSQWNNQGGDFVGNSSATGNINEGQNNTFSSQGLINDAQNWVSGGENFGWILIGNENSNSSTVRMDSREGTFPPTLSVTYIEPNVCDVSGGQVLIMGDGTAIDVCSGDGVDDLVNTIVSGASGSNGVWVITDDDGNFMEVSVSPPFNFEDAGPGVCLIRFLSFEDGLVGLAEGNNVSDLEGCFALSTSIVVTRNYVNGGTLEIEEVGTEIMTCAGDGEPDPFTVTLTGNSGATSGFVISRTNGVIIGLLEEASEFDFENSGAGVFEIRHISADIPFAGLQMLDNISDASGCFDFSNAITATQVVEGELCVPPCEVDGGVIELNGGGTELTICAGDGVSDAFEVSLEGSTESNSLWLITDAEGTILNIEEGPPFDLEDAGVGTCLIWHLSYDEGLTGAEIGLNADEMQGCFDLSNAITVTRVDEGELCVEPQHFVAFLTGTQSAFPVLSKGYGQVDLTLLGNTLSLSGTYSNLSSDYSASHIHNAIAGRNGGVDFVLAATTSDDLTMGSYESANNTFALSNDQIDALLNQEYYINVHTADNPGGEIRGQVLPSADAYFQTNLLGSNEVPAVHTDGFGSLVFTLDDTTLTASGSFEGLSSQVATQILGGAHLHSAVAGRNGGVELPLNITFDIDTTEGIFDATNNSFSLSQDQIDALLSEGLYVNVHSDMFGSGELRGQVAPISPATFRSQLSGVQENPAICSDGDGRLLINYTGSNQITVSGSANNLGSPIVGAHLHMGGGGNNGGVSFPLTFDIDTSDMTSTVFDPANNTFEVDADDLELLCDRGLYANIHTEGNGSGELRGQVLPLAKSYFGTNLCSLNSVGPNQSPGTGNLQFELTDGSLTVSGSFSGLSGDYSVSHIHSAMAGSNGGVVTGLSPTQNEDLSVGTYEAANNTFELTDEQIDALLASDYYVNVHSSAFPAGEIRGQILGDDNAFPEEGSHIILPPEGSALIVGPGLSDTVSAEWLTTTDPDGDDVVYIWQVGLDPEFSSLVYQENVGNANSVLFTLHEIDSILAAAGVELTDTLPAYMRALGSDGSVQKAGNTLPFFFVPFDECPIEPVGGTITTVFGGTDIFICSGFETPYSFDETAIEGNSGANTAWVITDNSGTILDVHDAQPFDIVGAEDGVCLVWLLSYEDGITGLEIGASVDSLGGCFAFSNAITVTKGQVEGGVLEFDGGGTEISICINDTIPDDIFVIREGAVGPQGSQVVTDADSIIVGFLFSFDFAASGAGVNLIFELRNDDRGLDFLLGSHINDVGGCADYSNALIVNKEICEEPCEVDGGAIELAGGGTELTICAGDGASDAFDVALAGNTGMNSHWLITDPNGLILGLFDNPPFDLENAGGGVCLVWHISYEDSLEGLEMGLNSNDLVGCFDLSNAITVTRVTEGELCVVQCDVTGGTVSGGPYTFCVGDGMADHIPEGDVTVFDDFGDTSVWVVTDETATTILGLPGVPSDVDFDGAGAGICLVWNLSYSGELTGLEVDSSVAGLEGCFSFSANAVMVTRVTEGEVCPVICDADGGTVSGGPYTFCVGDGMADHIPEGDVTVFDDFGDTSVWVVTDETATTILGLPGVPSDVDFDGAGAGICLVWNLSYSVELTGLEVDSSVAGLEGCFSFSANAVMVTRVTEGEVCPVICDADGGTVSGGPYTFCVGDGMADNIPEGEVSVTDEFGDTSVWVVTDETGTTILGLPGVPSDVDFDGAGLGICLVWNLSYSGELTGLEVDSSIADLEGCFSFSANSVMVTRVTEGELCVEPQKFVAFMTGTQQVFPVLTKGYGQVDLTLIGNTLTLDGTFSGLTGNYSASHIHHAMAGQNGGVEFGLTPILGDDTTLGSYETVENTFVLTDEQIDALLNREYYINVHSNTSPGGEIRGQVLPAADVYFHTNLLGSNQVPSIVSEGMGGVIFTLDDTTLTASGSFADLSSDVATQILGGAHIHNAMAGQNGGVIFPLQITFDDDTTSGFFDAVNNSFALTQEQIDALLSEGLYVNVHTDNFGSGELRGQVAPIAVATFRSQLTGSQELPPVCSDGDGRLLINYFSDGRVTVSGSANNLGSDMSAAHLHRAGAGSNGGVAFPLIFDVDTSDTSSALFHPADNIFDIDTSDLDLLCDRGLYGNIHSSGFPGGELRGQVLPLAKSYFGTSLSGTNSVPTNQSSGAGGLQLEYTDGTLTVSGGFSGLTGDYSVSHIHSAAAGSNGGVAVGLTPTLNGDLTTGDYEASNNSFELTADQIDMLLAGDLYVNVHSSTFPGGEIRGQVLGDDNQFPVDGFNIIEPLEGGTITVGPGIADLFASEWESTTDPDLDDIVYIWQLGLDPSFGSLALEVNVGGSNSVEYSAHEIDSILAAAGVILTDTVPAYIRTLASDGSVNKASNTVSFDFAPVLEESCLDSVNGGTIELMGGGTEITICAGDGISDSLDITLEGNVGNQTWIIADAVGTILMLPDAPPFNFEDAGAGICRIWSISFQDSLTGLAVGMNTADLDGCYSLSNPIVVTRLTGEDCPVQCDAEGGTIEIDGGGTEIVICAGDGVPDPIEVIQGGNSGSDTSGWVITDTTGVILGLPAGPPFDLDGAGEGTCLIWYISYDTGLTGMELGMNANDMEGCFDLSNPITVIRNVEGEPCPPVCDAEGGTIEIAGGGTEITICAGDGMPDPIEVTQGGNSGSDTSGWVITDTTGTILGLPAGPPFDLDGAGEGTCLIWFISYDTGLTGLELGLNANDMEGCFDLSNPITVIRNVEGEPCPPVCDAEGGTIEIAGGGTEITICAGDGVPDPIDVTVTGNMGSESSGWVITDTAGNILALPAGPPFDLEGAGEGTCLIWHISFDEGLAGLELGLNANDLDGCFDLSNPITVIRNVEGDPCPLGCQVPDDIQVIILSENRFVVDWAPVEGAETYLFRVRFEGTKKWKERVLRFGSRATTGSRSGKRLEVQVQTICKDGTVSEFSQIILVELPTVKNNNEGFSLDDLVIYEDSENGIDLFPNPVNAELTISYKPMGEAVLYLYNIAGQQVKTMSLVEGETIHKVITSELDRGVYILSIRESGYELRREKIIKL